MQRNKVDQFSLTSWFKNAIGFKTAILPAIILFWVIGPVSAQLPGSAYQVVAKDASWCWFSDPRAVAYKGKSDRLYFSSINSKGDVVISAKNVKSAETETYILHQKLQIDDHNVPALLFLPDGKLLAFYTEHNGRFFMRKSKNSEDIKDWEEEQVINFGGKKITYAHPVMLKSENNRIYMFFRGSDWRPSISYSDDLGSSWSRAQGLIESKGVKNRPYLKVSSNNTSRIDFTFTDGHPGVEPKNSVYHMYYEKGFFHQTNGTKIKKINELPVWHGDVNKVYDAAKTGVKAWIADIALDKKDNPVIVYTQFQDDKDHRYHYTQWDGKKWQDEELCKAGGSVCVVPEGLENTEPNYSGGISLDHNDPSNVYLCKPVNNIFELSHWQKINTKWMVTEITSGSKENNMRPYVVLQKHKKNPIVLWMTGTYRHYTKFNTDFRIYQPKN
jgi:hypothetical protein